MIQHHPYLVDAPIFITAGHRAREIPAVFKFYGPDNEHLELHSADLLLESGRRSWGIIVGELMTEEDLVALDFWPRFTIGFLGEQAEYVGRPCLDPNGKKTIVIDNGTRVWDLAQTSLVHLITRKQRESAASYSAGEARPALSAA
jgi:hypothetical protein